MKALLSCIFSTRTIGDLHHEAYCKIMKHAGFIRGLSQCGIEISVKNPVTHNTWEDGKYTTYEIAIETTNKAFCLASSSVRRRYSEFHWLRKKLKKNHPLLSTPKLPSKKMFSERFELSFITERMKGLEQFVVSIIEEKLYMSDTTTHLFLQTDLPCKEIENYISGNLTDEFIENVWKAGGKSDISSIAGSEDSSSISTSSEINCDEPSASGFTSSTDVSVSYPCFSEVNMDKHRRECLSETVSVNVMQRSQDHDFTEIIIPEIENRNHSLSVNETEECNPSSLIQDSDKTVTKQCENEEPVAKQLLVENKNIVAESSANVIQDNLDVSLEYSINLSGSSP